ncbi:MAG: cytochrome c3 family protein [Gemmatales bacterium]|nr:cytochrome c3 family protein [Gemmatales bacterium]MDW8385600.1 hypothetical protein [Gemmatales bacterium]
MLPEMQQPGTPYLRPDRFAAWYALDYFRKTSWRQRWKWWLTGLAVGACFVWLVAVLLRGDEVVFASGPVTLAHSKEHVACRQCHTGWFRPAARLLFPEARSVHDADCLVCHQAQAPSPHHVAGAEDVACAVCHREHRGQSLLTQMPDGRCTVCHADLKRNDGRPTSCANVSSFVGDHPPFRDLQAGDSSRLRFNHEVHCDPSGVLTPAGTIQHLKCDFCHPATSGGCYLALPRYQTCQECHPITIPIPETLHKSLQDKNLTLLLQQPLPHDEPDKVRSELRRRLTRVLDEMPEIVRLWASDPPVSPFRATETLSSRQQPEAWLESQMRQAEYHLFVGGGGCRLCHVPVTDVTAEYVRGVLPRYAPTNLKAVWLPISTFSHAAGGHREQDCSACHPAAKSRQADDVLIPNLDSCRTCHRPGGTARYDCAECHRYHQAVERRGTCKASAIRQSDKGATPDVPSAQPSRAEARP